MTHQLNGLKRHRPLVAAQDEPSGAIVGFPKVQLGTGLLFAEMRNACGGKRLAAHESVAWAARPTGLERQTSHPVTQADERSDHVGSAKPKAVLVFALDGDGIISAIGLAGEPDHGFKKPRHAAFADLIVAGLERDVVGDSAVAGDTQICDRIGKKL